MENLSLRSKLLFITLGLSFALANFSLQACIDRDEDEKMGADVLSSLVFPVLSQIAGEDRGNGRKRKREEQIPVEGGFFNVELPDEILLKVFSFLNQKDIPSVTGVSQRWQRLMEDNQLWKIYAKKACLIRVGEGISQDKNYKCIMKDYCTPSFMDLGTLNEGIDEIWALGINFDGSVIVGHAYDKAVQSKRAFRWTCESGVEFLGILNEGREGAIESYALSVNFDGSLIIGADDGGASELWRGFRWTREGGMQSLGTLNGGVQSWAASVSSDGSVIVGHATDGTAGERQRGFRWTYEEGMQSLGTLGGGSEAYGVSADGSVIVGNSQDGAAQNWQRGFRWTREGGMQSLGTLNGDMQSSAIGVSSNGLVIIGNSQDGAAQNWERAFRWTREGGMQSLGTLNGGIESFAYAVSADGSVIVGTANDKAAYDQRRAFRWTQEKGMESVEKLLFDKGLLPPAWELLRVNGITPSGIVLIGGGMYKIPMGEGGYKDQIRAWRAVIPRSNLF